MASGSASMSASRFTGRCACRKASERFPCRRALAASPCWRSTAIQVPQGPCFDAVIPMHRHEALWIAFEGREDHPHAVKIGAGDINVLSGQAFDEVLRGPPEDYLVCPRPALAGRHQGRGGLRPPSSWRRSDGARRWRSNLAPRSRGVFGSSSQRRNPAGGPRPDRARRPNASQTRVWRSGPVASSGSGSTPTATVWPPGTRATLAGRGFSSSRVTVFAL